MTLLSITVLTDRTARTDGMETTFYPLLVISCAKQWMWNLAQ